MVFGSEVGITMMRMGNDDPVASMDNSGKIIYSKQNEMYISNVRFAMDEEIDGEALNLQTKDLDPLEYYPSIYLVIV